ncbi:ATP-binding protein, partial [Pirellulales bacterium]|nr:ATP-binding protein [Pirellulales bacterium]
MTTSRKPRSDSSAKGKLRIGDDWNAITIIALSQSNPLKAVAEFVENSIDAGAGRVQIVRGKQHGKSFLRILDDGDGIPRDDQGRPNFKYVATHICDSVKRQLKAHGQQGVQGEFGIGLLSFWTVGESLSLISSGSDGKSYQMQMTRGDPTYSVRPLRRLIASPGVELTISPLLPGIRGFSGEKLQAFLAAELRDRIRNSGVDIEIVDRTHRATYPVVPREYSGQLLHSLSAPSTLFGDVKIELYLADAAPDRCVGLYRSGTRVLQDVTEIDALHKAPWQDKYLQGSIDVPFLTLSPGTRLGVIHDERLDALFEALLP